MTNRPSAGLALAIVAALWLVVVLTGCEPDSKRPECNPPKDAGALKSMEQTPIVCSEDYCHGGDHIFYYETGQIWRRDATYRCTWQRLN